MIHCKTYHTQGPIEARWCPGQGTWCLSEANVRYWRKYLWHCWDFSAPPAVIRYPGNCGLLSHSLRP